jgi:hypothetical protein
MLKSTATIVMALFVGLAMAQDSASAIGDETAKADQGNEKSEAAPADARGKEAKEVVLPPGFKARKRGNLTLYCIRGKATGTRFPTESCYDEPGLRDYILKREASNREFDQNRAICSNPAVCAPQ